jgi:hypothetical protein
LWEVVADAALDRPGGVDVAILADLRGSVLLVKLARAVPSAVWLRPHRQLREVHAGQREHLKTWNQLTFDLGAMTRDEHGRLRLDCKLGTYYHSLSTSECLDAELSEAYAAWPDATLEFSWPRLERRAWLHEGVPDPVADGRHRSASRR